MADVEVSYKGSTIGSLSASGSLTLETEGKYCEDDIGITYTSPGGGGASTGTVTVVSNKAVIPRVAGKNNLFAYIDESNGDSYFTAEINRVVIAYKISWMFPSGGGYIVKTNNAAFPPNYVGAAPANTTYFWKENTNDITLSCSNKNTSGLLPNGTVVAFIWW